MKSRAMKQTILVAMGLAMLILPVADLYAHSWCQTRNNCRWWRKEFVANAVVGCIGFGLPLCAQSSRSCGTATASCGPKNCLWGQGFAWAQNGPGGCYTGGYRTGQAYYGSATDHFGAAEPSRDSAGDHNVASRVDFNADRREVAIAFDQVSMTSTVDSSFSRIDVYLFLDQGDENTPDEEVMPTPENTVWSGYLESRNGELKGEGLEALARSFQSDGETATLEAQGVVETIPFFGTDEEWEQLTVMVLVDGGHADNGR